MIQQFKLIEKKNLTHNVYEMIFEGENKLEIIPGQFITFLIDKIGGRAYSILKLDGKKVVLIIKKRELEEGGRGGSKIICELNIGESLKGVGPAGHFILQENSYDKLFICTGTGFVPLYNQIIGALDKNIDCKLKLIFGVRENKDLFYLEELKELKENNSNFDYELFLSKESVEGINKGYTTDYLTKENCSKYKEYYICGAPAMIEGSIEVLKNNGIQEENIYFEKY